MVYDEFGNVRCDTDESIKERLLQILEGYKPEDKCNLMRQDVFGNNLQIKGWANKTSVECLYTCTTHLVIHLIFLFVFPILHTKRLCQVVLYYSQKNSNIKTK